MLGTDLSTDELWAIERFKSAQMADFTGREPRVHFSAVTINRLMLGQVYIQQERISLPATGIRIVGAVIDGEINLEHGCHGDGTPLPILWLERCDIRSPIRLTSTRLRRLCLKDSRLSEILADNIHVTGQIDLSGIMPYPSGDGLGAGTGKQDICRISLRCAHIEDGIEGARAHLVGPRRNDDYEKYSQRSTYALDLPEAHINGDVRLFPDFVACGGVNINGAVINGSFQAHGAEFTAEQMHALDASGAQIHGSLALDTRNVSADEFRSGRHPSGVAIRFRCRGRIKLHNIIVDEDLHLHGAAITGDNGCISGEHMTVKGDASFCAYGDGNGLKSWGHDGTVVRQPCVIPFTCEQRIDLRGAQISGDLNFKGAHLQSDLDASSCMVGGHALFGPQDYYEKPADRGGEHKKALQRFQTHGEIKIDGLTVKGNLIFKGALLDNAGKPTDLKARGLIVNGLADFAPYVVRYKQAGELHTEILPFRTSGNLILDNASIGLFMDMRGAKLGGEVQASRLQVNGKLLMCGFVPDREIARFQWFEAQKRVDLSGAIIKSDFDLSGAKLAEGLRFRGGQVDSAFIVDVYDTEAYDGDPERRKSIDLYNARVNILWDTTAKRKRGRGQPGILGYDTSYFLRLEGFTYGRFPHYADGESLGKEEENRRQDIREGIHYAFTGKLGGGKDRKISQKEWLKARLTWIRKQHRGIEANGWGIEVLDWIMEPLCRSRKPKWWIGLRKGLNPRHPTRRSYNPDPYNTLYKYYKRMGAQSFADQVLRRKLTIERETGNIISSIVFTPFDFFFGWGLRPLRATAFFIAFITILSLIIARGDRGEAVRLPTVTETWDYTQSQVTGAVNDLKTPGVAVAKARHNFAAAFSLPTTLLPGSTKSHRSPPDTTRNTCHQARSFVRDVIYALETSIPTLNLGEKESCDFPPNSEPSWLAFKIVATLAGWIVFSLTVLTWTGLFRRNVEP